MNKQEFNRLAAEFLKLMDMHIREDTGELLAVIPVRGYSVFNPYDDANDMALLEEKLNMYTLPPTADRGKWTAFTRDARFDFNQIAGYGDSPHESRRSCAEKYLKEWKE